MKRKLFIPVICAVLSMAPSVNANAALGGGTSGTCSWLISNDSLLTISPTDGVSGTLDGHDWTSSSYRYRVNKVVVASGVKAPSSLTSYFKGLANCTEMDLTNLDVSNVTSLDSTFYGCFDLVSLKGIENWDVSNVTDLSYTFLACCELTSLDCIANWDVSNVIILIGTFGGCSSLVSLDLSGWDVSNVTSLQSTFSSCSSLTSLDCIKNWDVSKVTTMDRAFFSCKSLTSLDLSSWNVSDLTSLEETFYYCSSLASLKGLENWDVSKVTTMDRAFSYCSSLTSLDCIKNWDVSNVTSLQSTFSSCSSLTSLDCIKNWDVSNVTTLESTFYKCKSLTSLDLSSWNPARAYLKVTFYGCSSLISLDLSGLSNVVGFYSSNSSSSQTKSVFDGCTSLETLKTPVSIYNDAALSLPYTMYDWDNYNAEYTRLPGDNLTLHKTIGDATAITHAEAEEAAGAMYFNAAGQRIKGAQHGLNIVKMSNGKTKKMYVK